MANFKSRATLLLSSMLLFSLLLALWNVSALVHQRQAAQQSQLDLAKCHDLEQNILEMRHQTMLVAARDMESQELGLRIDAAAKQSQLNLASLDRVDPQTTQRVGNLDYVQKSTPLVFRKVELHTLAAFLYNVTDSPGMTVRQIRLQVPRGDVASTLWDVDATITCLIYAPTDSSTSRGD